MLFEVVYKTFMLRATTSYRKLRRLRVASCIITARKRSLQVPLLLIHTCTSKWIKMLSCHADHQEVSRCCTWDESEKSIAYKRTNLQSWNPPWFWNPEQTSLPVQNGANRDPRKQDWSLQNNKKVRSLATVPVSCVSFYLKNKQRSMLYTGIIDKENSLRLWSRWSLNRLRKSLLVVISKRNKTCVIF